MYTYEVKIPKDRIAVIIGKKGQEKKLLEEKTGTKIKIDSKEGDVIVSSEDSLKAFLSKDIVKAIGRGFNPKITQNLLNENYNLEIIDIPSITGKSKEKQKRLKGRAIGKEGKAKKMVEQITGTDIVIYGKTISIIGEIEDTSLAKRAMIDILSGYPHGPIYKRLQQRKKERARKL
ncbi:MAG: RNA-processing protein [Candidatus Woesearchaeota archaeon]|nr:MAG: RNA-processing protein [Candidatus Woesearchaeota archaeon]